MKAYLQGLLFVALTGWGVAIAGGDDRAGGPVAEMRGPDKTAIGRLICGVEGFDFIETGLHCSGCPEFSGRPNSSQGLEIDYVWYGRFTDGKRDELLLDTLGCEAHFENFGGAVLLYRKSPKSAAADRFELAYYQPGVRLDDCLTFGGEQERSLLVCNESEMAQGEAIGHVSSMEVSKHEIDRWRLFRWYDNSGSESDRVVSIVPSGMHAVDLDGDGQPELQVGLEIWQGSRTAFDKQDRAAARTVELVFRRKGQRFFATDKTRELLGEINLLTHQELE